MKKNYFKFLACFFLFIGLIFLSGCGQGKQAEKEKNNPQEQANSDDQERVEDRQGGDLERVQDEEVRRLIKNSQKEASPRPTSVNKINNLEEKGEINIKEAVKLRLTALAAPDELADDFRGEEEIRRRSSLNSDTKWILNNWDDLSEQEKREFEPYILPPDEEGSIFYGDEEEDLSGLFIKKAKAASPDWENREVNLGASAKLFYKQKDSWSESRKNEEEDRSTYLEIALEDSWPKFKTLLGTEPGERVYVYLVEMNDCGEAFMQNKDGARRCIVNIKADQSKKLLKASLAHELFHCFQYELASKYQNVSNDIDWIAEGTAVWAEDYIYPDYNTEHQYLPKDFFEHLDEELVTSKNDWEYGRYMWFYFLSQYYDDSYVVETLKKAANNDIRESAQNSVPEYKLAYQDYAFYNWNYGPFFKYKDDPEFPEGEHPRGNASKYFTDFEKQDRDYKFNLNKGGMDYRMHSFDPDKGAKYAIFEFEEHPEDITITALINSSGTWQKENWNQTTKKEICLADDQINLIVLIVANSNLKDKGKLEYSLKLEGECPKISQGTMILEQNSQSGPSYLKVFMKSEDVLEYNPESDCMEIVERTISCDYDNKAEMMEGTPMHTRQTSQGQGGVSETYYDQEERPIRICFESGWTTFALDPDTKDDSYLTLTNTLTGNEPRIEKTSCPGFWSSEHVIDPENISENRIQGEEVTTRQGMFGPTSMKIKYDYVFYKEN